MQDYWWMITGLIAGGVVLVTIGRWSQSVDDSIASFKEFTDEIRDEIKKIHKKISKLSKRLPSPTLESKSPVTLNDLGRDISKEIGGKAWAKELSTALVEKTRGKPDYEVYDLCNDYIKDEYECSPDQEALIRRVAYENALNTDDVLNVLVIELRDLLLSNSPVNL